MSPEAFSTALQNRKRFQKLLIKHQTLILFGQKEITRNHDVNYPFRQDSDFSFLTGYHEPNAALILQEQTSTLVIQRIDQHHQVWLGDCPTAKEIQKRGHFNHVIYMDELELFLKKKSKKSSPVWIRKKDRTSFRKLCPQYLIETSKPESLLKQLRTRKTSQELELMRKANKISGEAHLKAMATTKPGMFEYQAQANFESYIHKKGLASLAYPSIVASGPNAAVLHYHHNNRKMKSGDLLLIDAGAENFGYAADITRTFPVNGKFSKKQREIYEIVLEAQIACIEKAKPDVLLSELQDQAIYTITKGLLRLNLIQGDLEELLESGVWKLFYPHGVSHMLGLDVHDVHIPEKPSNRKKSNLRSTFTLKEGHVITVEPGLYFIPALLEDPMAKVAYEDILNWPKISSYLSVGGVRIEDDILVTQRGTQNLTRVLKEATAIEQWMQKN